MGSTAGAQTTVGAARYDIATQSNGSASYYTTPGEYKNVNSTVSVRTQPFTVLTSRTTSRGRTDDAGSYAFMYYNFRIVGAVGTRVSGTFTADLFASISSSAFDEVTAASSSFRLYSADGVGRFYGAAGNTLASGPSQFLRLFGNAGTLRFNNAVSFIAHANAEDQVELSAASQAQSGVTAETYVDPVIAIDPAYQGAYSLVLSPGVSNLAPTTTTTPEPGSLVLVATGVLGVVGVVRRRRIAV